MNSFFQHITDSFVTNLITENRYQMILEGLQVTLLITFCAVILGSLLGGLVCWARMNRRPWLQGLAKVYIDLMRGTPVLVLLMLMYYVFMAPLKTTGVIVAIENDGSHRSHRHVCDEHFRLYGRNAAYRHQGHRQRAA